MTQEEITNVRGRPRVSKSNFSNGSGKSSANGHAYNSEQDSQADAHDEEPEPRASNPGSRTRENRSRIRAEIDSRRIGDYRNARSRPEAAKGGFKFPFDPFRLIVALKRHWLSLFMAGCAAAVAGFAIAAVLLPNHVSVNLTRRDSPNAVRAPDSEAFHPRDYSDQTLFTMLKSGEILERVASRAKTNAILAPLQLTPGSIGGEVSIKPSANPDWVTLTVKGRGDLAALVELANLYAREVVDYTRDLQSREAGEVSEFLKQKLAQEDIKIADATTALRRTSHSATGDFAKDTESDLHRLFQYQTRLEDCQIQLQMLEEKTKAAEAGLRRLTPGNTRLLAAKQALEEMRTVQGKTDQHPDVIRQKLLIQELEKAPASEAATSVNNNPLMASTPAYLQFSELRSRKPELEKEIAQIQDNIRKLSVKLGDANNDGLKYTIAKGKLDSLNTARQSLAAQQRDAQLYKEDSMGLFKADNLASLREISLGPRLIKIFLAAIAAGMIGFFASMLFVLIVEALDTTLKTPADVTRITGLPVLATVGDLDRMSESEQRNWAFRTLTIIKGKLTEGNDQSLVCGITSSAHGEGRSRWVNLLVSAATERGLRVLHVDTRPTADRPSTKPEHNADEDFHQPEGFTNALLAPSRISEQLASPDSDPVVHIPLPGWVWNLERRSQWKEALDEWSKLDNLVIFVELPPASELESVLLSEHLPQLIWLTRSGVAESSETAKHFETLCHARCRLVGAVLNFEPPPAFSPRVSRWFGKFAAFALLVTCLAGRAAEVPLSEKAIQDASHKNSVEVLQQELQGRANPKPAPEQANQEEAPSLTNNLIFGSSQKRRSAWQQRLTLGPGDIVDIQFYGNPALTRTNVFVGPDGRLSYLQVQGLVATGLTIDELRERLDQDLSKYYSVPRCIITPVTFSSKKYYMLGKVAARGVYSMDRPLTIVEAVAHARGLESGLYQRGNVELTDLSHSFVVRNGHRLPLDLQRLFLDGDLSQNLVIEPNDYIFFASAAAREIYVLGEVINPGPLGFVADSTVMTALADRGGFTDKAFKKRVLVIRGSLSQPERFIVDVGSLLDGRLQDFKLNPHDIVYVSRRPWAKIEEIADDAAQAFIEGAITTWTGGNIGPVITTRLLPSTK